MESRDAVASHGSVVNEKIRRYLSPDYINAFDMWKRVVEARGGVMGYNDFAHIAEFQAMVKSPEEFDLILQQNQRGIVYDAATKKVQLPTASSVHNQVPVLAYWVHQEASEEEIRHFFSPTGTNPTILGVCRFTGFNGRKVVLFMSPADADALTKREHSYGSVPCALSMRLIPRLTTEIITRDQFKELEAQSGANSDFEAKRVNVKYIKPGLAISIVCHGIRSSSPERIKQLFTMRYCPGKNQIRYVYLPTADRTRAYILFRNVEALNQAMFSYVTNPTPIGGYPAAISNKLSADEERELHTAVLQAEDKRVQEDIALGKRGKHGKKGAVGGKGGKGSKAEVPVFIPPPAAPAQPPHKKRKFDDVEHADDADFEFA
ncbi:hypothetical protein DIPPA_33633 [Diplonema papillatum]|nr:hypothetical protein DIPPA_33633 [Diplonema papillatum]|eukprot:gene17257-26498_t